MTSFYTNHNTEQAESNLFSNIVVTRIDKYLVNNNNLLQNNFLFINAILRTFNSYVKSLSKLLININIQPHRVSADMDQKKGPNWDLSFLHLKLPNYTNNYIIPGIQYAYTQTQTHSGV
jgi:hypothetical protein